MENSILSNLSTVVDSLNNGFNEEGREKFLSFLSTQELYPDEDVLYSAFDGAFKAAQGHYAVSHEARRFRTEFVKDIMSHCANMSYEFDFMGKDDAEIETIRKLFNDRVGQFVRTVLCPEGGEIDKSDVDVFIAMFGKFLELNFKKLYKEKLLADLEGIMMCRIKSLWNSKHNGSPAVVTENDVNVLPLNEQVRYMLKIFIKEAFFKSFGRYPSEGQGSFVQEFEERVHPLMMCICKNELITLTKKELENALTIMDNVKDAFDNAFVHIERHEEIRAESSENKKKFRSKLTLLIVETRQKAIQYYTRRYSMLPKYSQELEILQQDIAQRARQLVYEHDAESVIEHISSADVHRLIATAIESALGIAFKSITEGTRKSWNKDGVSSKVPCFLRLARALIRESLAAIVEPSIASKSEIDDTLATAIHKIWGPIKLQARIVTKHFEREVKKHV